jgi:hypothetical protein
VALVLGHVAVAVAVVALEVLLLVDDAAGPIDPARDTSHHTLFTFGLAAVLVGQVVSIRELLRHRREHLEGRGHLEGRTLAAGMRRIALPTSFAFYPLLLGIPFLTLDPPPAPLLALLCALLPASLLLDHAHAGWTYRHLAGRAPGIQHLPAGNGTRLRRGRRRVAVLLALICAAALVLLVLTATQRVDTPGPARLVELLSSAGVAMVALLFIRPVLGVRQAVTGDVVHLATLDTAAAAMHRLGLAAALAAALVVAAVLNTADSPWLAAAPIIPLVLALGTAALQQGSNTCLNLGDTQPRRSPGRRPARPGNTYPSWGRHPR